MGERGGVNLYSFAFNNPISQIDKLGLICAKSKCVKISEVAEASFYDVVGGSLSIEAYGESCDCCCNGSVKKGGYIDVGVTLKAQIGLGAGTTITVFGENFGLEVQGPQISESTEGHYIKQCETVNGAVEIDKHFGLLIGGQVNVGEEIGITGSYNVDIYGEIGLHIDSSGANGYIEFGHKLTADLTGHFGAFNESIVYHGPEASARYASPRLSW
jgi:hypothetical protein